MAPFESVLKKAAKALPSSVACVLGVALLLFVLDMRRIYPVSFALASTSVAGGLNMYATTAVLACLAVGSCVRPSFRILGSKPLVVVCGAVASMMMAVICVPQGGEVFLSSLPIPLAVLVYGSSTFCTLVLLGSWMDAMRCASMRSWTKVLGGALVCLAGFEFVSLALRPMAIVAALALSPLLSAALLILKGRDADVAHDADAHEGCGKTARRTALRAAVIAVLFLFVMALNANALFTVETASVGLGTSPLVMLVSHASGVLTAGVVICLLAGPLWFKGLFRYAPLLIPACYALVLMVLNSGGGVVAYLAFSPLGLMSKLAYLLPLLLVQIARRRFDAALFAAAAIFALGSVLGAAPLFGSFVDPLSVAYGLAITALLGALIVLSALAAVAGSVDGVATTAVKRSDVPVQDREFGKTDAVFQVAAASGLTPRETEVLGYLADGWRSSSIAEKLTLSQATVKNHMGRIYGKLGVHSQEEIMTMVDQARSRSVDRRHDA